LFERAWLGKGVAHFRVALGAAIRDGFLLRKHAIARATSRTGDNLLRNGLHVYNLVAYFGKRHGLAKVIGTERPFL